MAEYWNTYIQNHNSKIRTVKTIYKYELLVKDTQLVSLPKGAKILTIQTQGPFPQLWAMVDTEEDTEEVLIETFGTGHPIKDLPLGVKRTYIGTYQLSGGSLIFHVFKIEPHNIKTLEEHDWYQNPN